MEWLAINFIWFFVYSVIGWVWEVIICSVPAKKFVNRGFLNGPYCPIYGAGAILVITLLGGIQSPALLFVAGAVLTCTLEYITSWAMEKLFHARWWDYSDKFMNINGRVCLLGATAFGTLSVLVIKVVHPAVAGYTALLPQAAISAISLALFALILTDTVYTVARLSDFNAKLGLLSEKLGNTLTVASMQRMAGARQQKGDWLDRLTADMMKGINRQERRVMRAFPKLRSNRYHDALERVRQYLDPDGQADAGDDGEPGNAQADEYKGA